MSISFVPEDMGGLVRLSVATKPFPGRHTQVEVEEFVRKVRTCSNYFMCRFSHSYIVTVMCLLVRECDDVFISSTIV